MEGKTWLMAVKGKLELSIACLPTFGECAQPRNKGSKDEKSSWLTWNSEDNRESNKHHLSSGMKAFLQKCISLCSPFIYE